MTRPRAALVSLDATLGITWSTVACGAPSCAAPMPSAASATSTGAAGGFYFETRRIARRRH